MAAAPPSLALLQSVAAGQGVRVEEADLESVVSFLTVLLPELDELEQLVPAGVVPAGLFLPPPDA